MSAIIISSKIRQTGKTVVLAALAHRFQSAGKKVTAVKPQLEEKDKFDIQNLSPELQNCEILAPYQAVSELASAGNDANSVLLVESVANSAAADKELAEDLDATVLVVLNHGESPEDLVESYGNRLGGIIVNQVPKHHLWEFEREDIPAAYRTTPLLGYLPEDRILLAPDLASVTKALDGKYVIGEAESPPLVENYLIGGLVLDWGPEYFRQYPNSCVIVRGDRPDVQLAALQSDTVKSLILTNGISPIDYVYYEAKHRKIPTVVVSHSTKNTVEQLAGIVLPNAFNHSRKLEHMLVLMDKYIKMDEIDKFGLQFATN